MGQVIQRGLPDAAHDGHPTTGIAGCQAREPWVEAVALGGWQQLSGWNGEVASQGFVATAVGAGDRSEGVEPVVATPEHDDDQNALAVRDGRGGERALREGARGERGGSRCGQGALQEASSADTSGVMQLHGC